VFNSLLIVCTGNICRSPVAEIIFRQRLEASARWNGRVRSAGIDALVDQGADPTVLGMMRERGFDLAPHRARQLTPEHVREADLVLVMETHQRDALLDLDPTARGKTFRLGHWIDADIPDPFRRGDDAHRATIELIFAASAPWLDRLVNER
jgi:protein-tyrosine phosphatase